MLWECERVRDMWERLNTVFTTFDPGGVIGFESLFVGFLPTIPILESVLTRVTRSIVSIDRSEIMRLPIVKQEIVNHCLCNIYSTKNKPEISDRWKEFKCMILNDL